MAIDPAEVELLIADIAFELAISRNLPLSAKEKLMRETEDILLRLLKLTAQDPTLSCPSIQDELYDIDADLQQTLPRWGGTPGRSLTSGR